jgi:hypothetical protein
MQSPPRWRFARSLGALAVIAAANCDQLVDARGKIHGNDRPMIREQQVNLDVTAIIEGMARAHGGRAVASVPVP